MPSDPDTPFFNALAPEEEIETLDTMLWEHAERTAERVLQRLRGPLAPHNLDQFLNDDACVRYPVTIVFNGEGLEPHQFAEPHFQITPEGKTCTLHIDPRYRDRFDALPYFIAYMTPVINYGHIVTPAVCEHFGAMVMQMGEDTYYRRLCELVDG